MFRRTAIFVLAAGLRADERDDITDFFTQLAARLSEENAGEFLRAFRRGMTGRAALETNIHAITRAYEIASSLNLLSIEAGTVKADWYLKLNPHAPGVPPVERRKVLEFKLERVKKSWVVTAFDDPAFFAAP